MDTKILRIELLNNKTNGDVADFQNHFATSPFSLKKLLAVIN